MATVCLDPGHGGRDAGAVRDGLEEKRIALEVALAARAALRPAHRVVLTRDGDITLPLVERRGIAETARADLFVSIHVNASTGSRARGVEVFVRRPSDPASLILAAAVLQEIIRQWPDRRNRGIKPASLGVLRQRRPAVLVECFFLSHPAERALLGGAEVRAALGRAIARGCEAFLRRPALSARARAVRAEANRGRTGRRAARSPRPRGSRPV
ncbi:MAG: N-acetylmuramoyl-L-alanine amidase [Armatimonadetes bacterium]|nr:N-acetylmuramoyl-L-alanine amidase [Armatimonadota bacterium]